MSATTQEKREKMPNIWHLFVMNTAFSVGSFSRAAEQIGLTQSAVSQAVAALERRYQSNLADRAGVSISPTPEGSLLKARADRALAFLTEGLRESAGIALRRSVQTIRVVSAKRLEALTAIVRYGGFALAARALGVSAPTIHRAVRDLERAIGAVLFEATSYGVRPTRHAETLARYASLAFSELRQADAEILALKGKATGRTVIGAMPLARSRLVPVAAEEFSRVNSGHRISILEGAYDDLLAGLRRGDVDIIIGAIRENLSTKDVVQEELFIDPLAIVMRADHPLLVHAKLTKKDLSRFPWIAPRLESPLRQRFESLFHQRDAPADIIECNSLSAARVILMRSDRLMLLSDAQISYEAEAGWLKTRPFASLGMTRPIGLTIRRSWAPTVTQQELLKAIRRHSTASVPTKNPIHT